MKRRYKRGDWLRVRLGGEYDAIAIITQQASSRLFGYFFIIPATDVPTPEQLRALRADDAAFATLFGGAALDLARWDIIATALAFDPDAWPFPQFASRGAFGGSWRRRVYDPQSMQIVQTHVTTVEQAMELPDARFATPQEVERRLRAHAAGEHAQEFCRVYELRSPITLDADAFHGATRLQFSSPLQQGDLDVLARALMRRPELELRVHGFRAGFDARMLTSLHNVQHLLIDVHRVQHGEALRELRDLRTLGIGNSALSLPALGEMPSLQSLRLRGTRADLAPVLRCTNLQRMSLEHTQHVALADAGFRKTLRELRLAHGAYHPLDGVAYPSLERLALHALEWSNLPDFAAMPRLRTLHLCGLPQIRDLRPLLRASDLQELEIVQMPHLDIWDFAILRECANLRRVTVDIGSRSKNREIYRLFVQQP